MRLAIGGSGFATLLFETSLIRNSRSLSEAKGLVRRDYYFVLEVQPEASIEEIKRAYRRLVRQYHPDAGGGSDPESETRFREIQEAYETLSDTDLKKEYDAQYPHRGQRTAPSGTGSKRPSGVHQAPNTDTLREEPAEKSQRRTNSKSSKDPEFESHEDRMARLMQQQRQRQRSVDADDAPEVEQPTKQSGGLFDKLFDSVKERFEKPDAKRKSLRNAQTATGSFGTSRNANTSTSHLRQKNSAQRDRIYHFTLTGLEALAETTREIAIDGGEAPKLIRVKIPAGVSDNTVLNINCPAGDGQPNRTFRVKVTVEPHPLVERNGSEITLSIPITIEEAMSGATITVPVAGGTSSVKIATPWQPFKRIKLAGQGLKDPSSGKSTDLYIKTFIVVPSQSSEATLMAAKAIDSLHFADVRKDVPKRLG